MHVLDGEFTGDPDLQDAIRGLGYESSAHAVLHRSVFPPPSIVAEVGTRAIVNAVRRGSFDGLSRVDRFAFIPPRDAKRLFGIEASDPEAPGVYVDDNACAHFALSTCFTVRRHIGSTQVCHIFPREFSQHPRFFTALPNLLLAPAWLAKLTDNDEEVKAVLRWAVRLVYGFCPRNEGSPSHSCSLCERPSQSPGDTFVHECLGAHEVRRVRDYVEAAHGRRDQRWRTAIDAGRGYSHVVLRP